MKKYFILFSLAITYSYVFAQSSWTNLTPIRTTTNIRSCYFVNSNTGYAVADVGGFIIKTINGGIEWSHVWAPTITAGLYSVWFTSNDTGYVAGASGAMYKTEDAANTWAQLNIGTSQYIYSLFFTSSNVGYASGSNGTLIKTNDAGATWTFLTSTTTKRLLSVYFTSASTGFVCGYGGTVLRTNDGGTTWTLLPTNITSDLNCIYFPTSAVGYAAGVSGTVITTSDSGNTWTSLNTNSTKHLNNIFFTNASTGFIFGNSGTYLKTTNGGNTWINSTVGSTDLFASFWINSSKAFLMGDGKIYSTNNGASTWQLLKQGIPSGNINSLFFTSPSNGVAVGDFIIQTTDGGQIYSTSKPSADLYGVHFPNSTNGWSVGSSSSQGITTNGGTTWTVSTNSTMVGAARCVYYQNNSVGFAGGGNFGGSICKTIDGGNTYSCQSAGVNKINKIFFTKPDTGYIVGDGSILKTNNNGITWTTLNISGTSNFISIYFTNDSVGYIGSEIGTMFRTSDFGNSWGLVPYPFGGGAIVGIYFPTNDSGYVVTSAGKLFKTLDAGNSWTTLASPDNNTFGSFSCSFFNGNEVYGAGTEIYKFIIPPAQPSVGILTFSETNNIQLFPNPTTGKFTICNLQTAIFNLKIFNVLGKVVHESEMPFQNHLEIKSEVDISSQPKGIYFVQVKTEEEIWIGKMMVE